MTWLFFCTINVVRLCGSYWRHFGGECGWENVRERCRQCASKGETLLTMSHARCIWKGYFIARLPKMALFGAKHLFGNGKCNSQRLRKLPFNKERYKTQFAIFAKFSFRMLIFWLLGRDSRACELCVCLLGVVFSYWQRSVQQFCKSCSLLILRLLWQGDLESQVCVGAWGGFFGKGQCNGTVPVLPWPINKGPADWMGRSSTAKCMWNCHWKLFTLSLAGIRMSYHPQMH